MGEKALRIRGITYVSRVIFFNVINGFFADGMTNSCTVIIGAIPIIYPAGTDDNAMTSELYGIKIIKYTVMVSYRVIVL